ncbi:DEAD/DEAH box helicase [Brevibacillus agri]|uniref:DEAD/DEAH box helicase n=1 Tax=Brevibacillus agri TaxID=51101 RepID=UPI002E21AC6A|nr:DEAD/DEAH box helicase [Brevibacillus agri]MED4572808.1 DEAD/DEAH box helicase [Brevibacillus agri]
MEQVTNPLNINDLLLRLKSSNIARDFKNILEALTVHCIDLDLNLIDVGEDKLERNIKAIRSLEKVIIYLFSEYNSILKQYDGTLTKKAMQLCALASEKIGDYLNHVNEEKLETLSQDQVLNKQLKMYWRATIAYTLCDNPPNSFVVVEKFEKVLSKLESKEIISNEMRNIYKFSYFLLRRYFINNIEKHIDDEELIGIFIELRAFVLTGDRTSAENAVQLLDRLIKNTLSTYRTNEFWHLKYLASCIERIISNSIWNNLTDIFSGTYLQQLIKSKPPVLELWPNQVEVVNNPEGYLRNQEIKRTMINFPTSGGKSLLAEFAIVRELERDITKKCFYIVPTNALVYEVTKRLRDRFRRLGYKVSSSISGYEPDFVYGNFSEDNVVVTTPEKLEMIIRNNLSNDLLSNISLIIFDEFHKIQDRERGWVIEGSISYLINHEIFSRIKIIMLSAIIDNVPTVMEWVDETKQCSSHLPNNWKPTIKLKGVVSWEIEKDKYGKWLQLSPKDGLYRKGYKNFRASARIKYRMNDTERQLVLFRAARYLNKRDNKVAAEVNIKKENFIMGVAQKLKNIGGSLIFFHSKDECEEFVRNYTPMFPERLEINDEIKHLILYIEKRLGSNHLLTIGLNKGLVYHHGSLPIDIREALEDYYLKGHIKIMVCTTTLVEGVNFPIQNFIHSGRSYRGQRTLSPGDFKNIVGRAGRAYQSTFGQIIYINYFNNVIDEHLNYEQHPNIVYSSLVDDDKFFDALTEVENTEQELQLSLLLGLTSYPFVKSLLLFYNGLTP